MGTDKSKVAQFVFDSILNSRRDTLCGKAKLGLLQKFRDIVIARMRDPVVDYQLCGSTISIPLSHQLPSIRRRYPYYSSNIGRLSRCVKAKYPELTFIDIGANVGDTVAIVREIANFPILCIDGDSEFGPLLEVNTKNLRDVAIERAFVGDGRGLAPTHVKRDGGTAHLVMGEVSEGIIETKTLDSILKAHPRFKQSKLIKLDTDGMDCLILMGAHEVLQKLKPIVFFEYDPYFFEKAGNEGFRVFETLREVGYSKAMIFENTGNYLMTIELCDQRQLEDIHHFFSGWGGERYCDIAAFHAEDDDIWSAARNGERTFMSVNGRGVP